MINIPKLLKYLMVLLTPFAIVGILSRTEVGFIPKEDAVDYFGVLIIVYIPLVSYLRVRSLGYGFKDFLLSLIPFNRWKYYSNNKNKEKEDKDKD